MKKQREKDRKLLKAENATWFTPHHPLLLILENSQIGKRITRPSKYRAMIAHTKTQEFASTSTENVF